MTGRDPEALAVYKERAACSIAEHGGRYLVRGGDVECVEGEWPDDRTVVLVEFPSEEAMRTWYSSAAYAEALAVKEQALQRRLTFLQGAAGLAH